MDLKLAAERDALVAEIEAAFEGVTREGGKSWRDAEVADFYGDEAFATWIDTDTRWQDLADDPNWYHASGNGGFCFLDPIGFRYFLPAAMIQAIRSSYNEGIQFHLTIASDDRREHHLNKVSLLDNRQMQCVRRFIEYMIAVSEAQEQEFEVDAWREALESYWKQF